MAPRGPMKRSHLRQVSAASLDSLSTARSLGTSHRETSEMPEPIADGGPPRPFRISLAGFNRRPCTLWVHDESFARDEVLFNPAAFTDTDVRVGDVVEILPNRGPGETATGAAAAHLSPSAIMKPDHGVRSARESHVERSSTRTGPAAAAAAASSKFTTPLQNRCLFVVKPLPPEILARHPKLEISVTSSIANIFGFKNRTPVLLSIVERAQCAASHVELSFRDQFLVRSDMWRLVMSDLVNKVVYKGQKILFMGTIRATVKAIFIRGKKVLSGYFSPHTIPVFRSESAKYVLFIQMSREMWDFDSEGTGDILFSRVINGFLPELFKRWVNIDAKHLVTIVLFTRVEYDASAGAGLSTLSVGSIKSISTPNHVPTRDFYRVVVNDMASGHWTTILDELKRDFRTFLRDVSLHKVDDSDAQTSSASIAGRPSTALRGNILEAIHLASAHLAFDHLDRDMIHTGTSIIVITPGSGVFEVSYDSLASTTEALTNRGIAIDLVCLSPMPLHSVPLFKYREPGPPQPPKPSFSGIHSAELSPDLRHASPSFLSRSSHLSPGSYDPLAHPLPREMHSTKPKDWSYGIPHWLDISFWNPETYREARRLQKKDPNAPIPFTITKQSKLFKPRVRMYEIQMMGVMESEQSNISIPYLSEGQGPSRTPGSALMLNATSFSSAKSPYRHSSSSFRAQLSDSLRPEPFLQNMASSKEMFLPGSKKSQKSMLTWMDQYDEAVFHPFPKRRATKKSSKSKRPSEPEVVVSAVHERVSARAISKLREHEDHLNERAQAAARGRVDLELSFPKSPVSTTVTTTTPTTTTTTTATPTPPSPKKPALKTTPAPRGSRISRTISFALRGLSATPPRAQASTEVNVEHAQVLPTKLKSPARTLSDNRSVESLSPSDTASTSTVIEVSSPRPGTPQKLAKDTAITPSRPISIKVPVKKPSQDDSEQSHNSVIRESFSTPPGIDVPFRADHLTDHRPRQQSLKFDVPVNAGFRERSLASKSLSPWVRSIDPCSTHKKVFRDASWFGRWQHAYPRPPHVALVKWKSLKSPAVLPITTEEFPTATELTCDYLQTPYRVFPNEDSEGIEAPKTRDALLREMISLRLSHGFQLVVGGNLADVTGQYTLETVNVFDDRGLDRDGTTVFLSKGNAIHRLVCVDGGEIEVTRYTHRASTSLIGERKNNFTLYSPAIRTILSPKYEVKDIRMESTVEEYNWNYADNYTAGHRDYLMNPSQQLQFWRARYVLIPLPLHANTRRHLQSFNQSLGEDNEEEIHLLGISQLTHMWQRYKYVAPEEKRFETGSNKKRGLNPLDIIYQTRNPSEIVAAELDRILLTDPRLDNPPAQLLPESELLDRSNISLSSLAQIMQGEKGVRLMDRRWHWRLHYNCFIGNELTTWLVQNFRDIDTREEAVEFGNELFRHGLFEHVEKRHNFRDGNYFYQIASEYRHFRPESRTGWFPPKRSDKSVPSTPAGERPRDSPAAAAPSSSSHARSDSTEQPHVTPGFGTPSKTKNKVAITLSKTMKYDVDPRKRSNRPEVVDLHYDRLHNPENCFHIELGWMNTTPKLIEDTVLSWGSTAERFGLKLVQVPISEVCAIERAPRFRQPFRIQLKIPPPKAPVPTVMNVTSSSSSSSVSLHSLQPGSPDNLYFQKALLRKFEFVLDFEADSAYPPDVEVSYSWGKPEYRYPQYIHRSGTLLVQITDDGDFLLLANRLLSTRGSTTASRDAAKIDRTEVHRPRAATYDPLAGGPSPRLSPALRPVPERGDAASPFSAHVSSGGDAPSLYRAPEYILHQLLDFCSDAARLEQFYSESHVRPASTRVGPATASLMEASIPSLELPASLVGHHISPPPALSSRLISQDGTPWDARARTRTDSVSHKDSPRSGSLRPLL
ncbi:hypothetical protein ASPZODRAFT_151387 [Penicilliopsis zonata CBS 506.65]|uniref:Vacuolar membrane-associated protein IML1 n=1 Tax=Penicilliopsis zonata CBS 506.65 TaxID=1073090 RepID=A0A1L9SLA3_9EURO|nr:hypothetical protein ASPZODRAFT_151387 [Penicilliopsis zonata CBS 506.65]OJJ47975.1 hypothetical protein ASPZODRAFT_151387 [Penicilliopsis zonata CBS 506.65]